MMFVDMISESGIDDLLDDLRNETKVRDRAVRRRVVRVQCALLQQRPDNGHFAAARELRLAE